MTAFKHEYTEVMRTAILAFILANRQASVPDLCSEFELDENEVASHLRVLKDENLAHRAIPMTFYDRDVGQVWAAGPRTLRRDDDFAEPIQVTVHHWKRPEQICASLLESIFFVPKGAPA